MCCGAPRRRRRIRFKMNSNINHEPTAKMSQPVPLAPSKNYDIFRKTLFVSLIFLTGIFAGFFILRFPANQVLALVLGMGFIALSIWKIEISFYACVFFIIIFTDAKATTGSIFQYVRDLNYPGIPSLVELAMGSLILSFIVRMSLQREKLQLSPINLTVLIFLGLLGLSFYVGLQNGVDRTFLKEDFKQFLVPLLFFICCVNILSSWKKINSLMIFVFALVLIKSCLGNAYYLKGFGFPYQGSTVVFFGGR